VFSVCTSVCACVHMCVRPCMSGQWQSSTGLLLTSSFYFLAASHSKSAPVDTSQLLFWLSFFSQPLYAYNADASQAIFEPSPENCR